MRAGGGGGLAAAQELLRRARAGAVTPAELREVQKVVTSPELSDAFGAVARQFAGLEAGSGGEVFRDVAALTPDTGRLTDARALPERFLSDLRLVERDLLHHPGLTRQQKAQRLFAFFEAYAARFQQLGEGEVARSAQTALPQAAAGGVLNAVETGLTLAPPLTEPERARALAQFDKALRLAGFEALRTADGRSGLEVARELLEARDTEAMAEAHPAALDAPSWKDNPPRVEGRAVALPEVRTSAQAPASPEEAARKRRGERRTDQVLGGRMVWNVLHLLRGEDLTDVARKDAMTQLAIAAGLLLLLGGVLVGVLVLM